MLIQKFGGTSVGSPNRIRQVAELIADGDRKIVVLSAVSGTTNKLVSLGESLVAKEYDVVNDKFLALKEEYNVFVSELLPEEPYYRHGRAALENQWKQIQACIEVTNPSSKEEKILLAQGELISTQLFAIYMKQIGKDAILLPALEFMKTNEQGDPDIAYIRKSLNETLAKSSDVKYFITQGYICLNAANEIDNLQRGGSDYTATILGAALFSNEIQIWTDIDGLHNNDPRIVNGTEPVREISYREAAELAYFGAKILHPTCVIPAEVDGVPIRLKNTFEPEASGTLISEKASGKKVTAIAAKDKITAIKIRSGRMLNAYGFLRKVFEVFEKHKTPIDMITTSEISVSLTIDHTNNLSEIIKDLTNYAEVSVENEQTIICIVGDSLATSTGCISEILSALSDVPLRMVSYGGSSNNISVLVDSKYKSIALQSLHEALFTKQILV